MQKIKNIIFDLGGVFINIDYSLTENAFNSLGIEDFRKHFTQHNSSSLFADLETGRISDTDFFQGFRSGTGTTLTDDQITKAWNAMLGAFPKERLDWLVEISKKYTCYLLSNTNTIHYNGFMRIFMKSTGETSFNKYFRNAYYSHQLGLRKPDAAIFEKVLQLEQLSATETLFIDDTVGNIEGAEKAGLKTLLLQKPQTLLDLQL